VPNNLSDQCLFNYNNQISTTEHQRLCEAKTVGEIEQDLLKKNFNYNSQPLHMKNIINNCKSKQ
jgi:hypothetical protein